MPVDQLGQLTGYQQFTDWSNNKWHMGNDNQAKIIKKCVSCYTTAEYTPDPATCWCFVFCVEFNWYFHSPKSSRCM